MAEHPARTHSLRLIVGLVLVYAVLQGMATALESLRGEAGIGIALAVVAGLMGVECFLFQRTPALALRELGLGRPSGAGLLLAAAISGALLGVLPGFALATGTTIALEPGWSAFLPGLFAQAGIAEEVLFRGYLFGHLRRGRSFWRAAVIATGPFVLVHLILFTSMAWPIALAAVVLSVTLSFPLARMYELAGRTIWAPAVVHTVVQGAIKVIAATGPAAAYLPLVWMAAAASLPFCVFLVRAPRSD